MDLRNSYTYAKPTTLVMIITDALECVYPRDSMSAEVRSGAGEIIMAAYAELEDNQGTEGAIEMLLNAKITPDALEPFLV